MHNFFSSYESMKSLCDKYNRAIDSIRQLVSCITWIFLLIIDLCNTIISHSSFLFIAMLKIARLLKNCMRFICLSFALKFPSLV